MDERTVAFYDEHSRELSDRYESADMSHLYHLLARHLPEKECIFEIGGGTGRDAAHLLAQGHDVTIVDASPQLVSAALKLHPELQGRIHAAPFPLPDDSELLARRYGAVVSIAVLMHVPDKDLFAFAYQVWQLLRDGGVAIFSISTGRRTADGDRDGGGRLFRERPPGEITLLFERIGFRSVASYETPDAFGRDVMWHFLVFQLEGGLRSRSVDQVEAIIRRDR
jgi:SAM-dependent methyltransferase